MKKLNRTEFQERKSRIDKLKHKMKTEAENRAKKNRNKED